MASKSPVFAGLVASASLLAACSSAPPAEKPSDQISEANFAVEQADELVSNDSQSLPLYRARNKLDKARELVASAETAAETRSNYPKARRLAEEAIVEARYASAKARSASAEANSAELQESLEALKQEINRLEGAE